MDTMAHGLEYNKRTADDVLKENGVDKDSVGTEPSMEEPQHKKLKTENAPETTTLKNGCNNETEQSDSQPPSDIASLTASSLPEHLESATTSISVENILVPPESIPVSPVPTDSNPDADHIIDQLVDNQTLGDSNTSHQDPTFEIINSESGPISQYHPPLDNPLVTLLSATVPPSFDSLQQPDPLSSSESIPPKRERKMSHRYDDYEQPKAVGAMFGKSASTSSISSVKQLSKEQHKHCAGILRNMKRHKDAYPFLVPVDPIKLGIPDYPLIITHPMDLTTIEKKLNAGEYDTVESFVAEFHLMFNNSRKYNGAESVFAKMADNLEKSLMNQIKKIPKEGAAPSTSKASKAPKSAASHVSRSSTLVDDTRPRREIHPPARDLPSNTPLRKKSNRTVDDLKFCSNVLKELMKKQYSAFNSVFLEPVPRTLYPMYYQVIKHPMDLGTMKAKLENGAYASAHEFEADMRLIISNCKKFNPPGTDVYQMGRRLEDMFNAKWAERGNGSLKSSRKATSPRLQYDQSSSSEQSSSDEESSAHISLLERQLELMQAQIAQMRNKKKKKKDKRRDRSPSPFALSAVKKPERKSKSSASKVPKPSKPTGKKPSKSKAGKRSREEFEMDEEAEFTFEMKKELGESINTLSTDKLTEVIRIIQESMPHLMDSSEEIELDISALDASTLWKLYRLVCNSSPQIQNTQSQPIPKRKRMTDDEQKERLRQLEAQLGKFGNTPGQESSDSDNDSDDDSEESGSDSD